MGMERLVSGSGVGEASRLEVNLTPGKVVWPWTPARKHRVPAFNQKQSA